MLLGYARVSSRAVLNEARARTGGQHLVGLQERWYKSSIQVSRHAHT